MFIQVSYEIGDVMHHDFEANSFDVVYSRDTILHITDKMSLFSRLYVRLIVFRNYLFYSFQLNRVGLNLVVSYLLLIIHVHRKMNGQKNMKNMLIKDDIHF